MPRGPTATSPDSTYAAQCATHVDGGCNPMKPTEDTGLSCAVACQRGGVERYGGRFEVTPPPPPKVIEYQVISKTCRAADGDRRVGTFGRGWPSAVGSGREGPRGTDRDGPSPALRPRQAA